MEKKVSIIMGAYNCESTLRKSIDSILNQTYNNWEFIICDDGSTDKTYEILEDYKIRFPEKFTILRNEKNLQLGYTLNHCLKYSSGDYIARMDADDISEKYRIETQVSFLNNNADIDLVGTGMQRYNENGLNDVVYPVRYPDKNTLFNTVPFFHATIMTKKKVYEDLNGYSVEKKTIRVEDVDLWYRFYERGFYGENILKPLYFVKEDKGAIRRRTIKNRYNALLVSLGGYKKLKYPIVLYVKPIIEFFVKSLVPYKVQDLYRKYQGQKNQSKEI